MLQQQRLSRRERQIMEIVYRLGEPTAAQILEQMSAPPSYSALRALLRILVDKQHLQHRADGPRYVYWPVVSRTRARAAALTMSLSSVGVEASPELIEALAGGVTA